jgi:hypothetical protein
MSTLTAMAMSLTEEGTMPTGEFSYYEVVKIRKTPDSANRGIANAEAVVLGLPEEGEDLYTVFVYSTGTTFVMAREKLLATGRFEQPENIYDGTSIRVSPEGDVRPSD